jgi:hypothetical protein
MAGRGSSGSGVLGVGWMPSRCRALSTRSAKSGARASLVGQPTSKRPCSARKALSGRVRPVCRGSARSDSQGRPLGLAHVDPRQQVRQFLLRRGDLLGGRAVHAFGLGNITAHVPHPTAIGGRVRGDGDARLGAAAQAVRVQRFEAGALGDDHMQRAFLHGRLAQAQGRQQLGGAAAGTQHDALGADIPAVDFQADRMSSSSSGSICCPASRPSPASCARRSIRLGTSTTSSARR